MSKILVVDDSAPDREKIRGILSDAGHRVVTANDGGSALEAARQERPDLIFLDIIMPEMDGFATCRELSRDADTREIPVVFVTSKDQKADRLWAQMQGAKGYITKPYESQAILDSVDSLA